jgi:hypothetical protein
MRIFGILITKNSTKNGKGNNSSYWHSSIQKIILEWPIVDKHAFCILPIRHPIGSPFCLCIPTIPCKPIQSVVRRGKQGQRRPKKIIEKLIKKK